MAEFVEAGGRYVFDPTSMTVKTVLVRTGADGDAVSEVCFVTTVQIFKVWAAQMRACEAEIDQHFTRENVVAMGDFRRHAADTA